MTEPEETPEDDQADDLDEVGCEQPVTDEHEPPNEKPINLPFDDWKDALREFFRRQDEDVRPEKRDDQNGGE